MPTYSRYSVEIHNNLVDDVQEMEDLLKTWVTHWLYVTKNKRKRFDTDIEVECEEHTGQCSKRNCGFEAGSHKNSP